MPSLRSAAGKLLHHPVLPLVVASLFGQAVTVVTGPLLVRLLGVDRRGELALVYVLVLLISTVGVLGLPSAITYFAARDHVPSIRLIRGSRRLLYSLTVGVGLATCAGVGLAASTGFDLSSPVAETVLVGAGVVIFMWMFILGAGLQGDHLFRQLAITKLVMPTLFLVSVVAMFAGVAHATVSRVLFLNLAAWLVMTLLTLWFLWPRRGGRHRIDRPSPGPVTPPRTLVRFGVSAAMATVMPVDGLSIDQLFLGVLSDHHNLGLYVIGYGFESLPVIVLISVASVVGPQLTRLADVAERRAATRQWFLRSAALAIIACAAVEAVLKPVLLFAFGHPAADAVPLARILVLAGLFLGLRRVGVAAIQAWGLPGRATTTEVIGFVTLLAVGIPWTIQDGARGMAWSLTVAGAVCVVAQVVVLSRISRDAARPVGAGAEDLVVATTLPTA